MKVSQQITISIFTVLLLGLLTAYGLAQPKSGAPAPKAVATTDAGVASACGKGPCTHGGMDCPMHSLSALADVKVEKTKTGASLQLTAKDLAKVSDVQALAEKLGAHLRAGDCPMKDCAMMKGGDGHPHGHHHGQLAAPAK